MSRVVSNRELYSLCRQLTGIYLVAKWLRPACTYLKRMSEGDLDYKIEESLMEKVIGFLTGKQRRIYVTVCGV